MMSYN